MNEEYSALLHNNTWSLVPHRPSYNVVGSKWVFRVKRRANGTVEHYKARLVAKGLHQQEGLDFEETHSLVVKHITIKTILSLVVTNKWVLWQLDVCNAFLHGFFLEDVYMSQPLGYHDTLRPNHVCKLHRALMVSNKLPGLGSRGFILFS